MDLSNSLSDPRDRAGVLLGAGGKPSTWFPPGGLVEQDLTRVVFSCVKKTRKNDKKNDQIIKVLEFDGDSNPLDEISKF